MYSEDCLPLVFLVILLVLGGLGIWWLIARSRQEEAEWQVFKGAHRCRVVGHMSGQTAVTSGGHVAFISAQDSWLCDDGITYTRDRE